MQTNSDTFELKVDNKSFELLMLEEKTAKYNEPEVPRKKETGTSKDWKNSSDVEDYYNENKKRSSTSNQSQSTIKKSPSSNFYNEEDFDFSGGNGNNNFTRNPGDGFNNFAKIRNSFSNSNNNQGNNLVGNPTQSANILIDINDILEKPSQSNCKETINANLMNFDMNQQANNQMTYLQNKNIINNIKVFEDDDNSDDEPNVR